MSFQAYDANNVANVVYEMTTNNNPAGAVGGMSTEELDVCMKYCYEGMADPNCDSQNALLKWHAEVFKKGGSGCIMRAMCMVRRS
jgi:ARP2/3 complex 16 kDa subunit (p16-Arc)